MRVVVTGGAGRSGSRVVETLREHGHDVLSVDIVPFPAAPHGTHLQLDLTDLGETAEAFTGADAVLHLGAVWAAGIKTDASTYSINSTSTFNVFQAARITGVRRVVWASTGAVTGSPFEWGDPDYLPVDIAHPLRPRSSYALSKQIGEEIGRYFADVAGLEIVGLRLSWMLYPDGYGVVKQWNENPMSRRFNLFSYADVRDVVEACRLAVETDVSGAHAINVCAADTCIDIPSADLASQAFPGAAIARPLDGYESLLSLDEARAVIGYDPQHSWRDNVQ